MLTDQKKLFVASYLQKPVGSEAAIAAGYSERTARSIAHRLLKEPEVAAAIEAGQGKLARKFEITTEAVLQELAAIGFANIADFLDGTGRINIKALDRAKLAAVSELIVDILPGDVVRTRIKLHDKRAALVDLGKHLGLFKPQAPDLDPPDADDEFTNLPARVLARRILFLLQSQMRSGGGKAAPAAAPTQH